MASPAGKLAPAEGARGNSSAWVDLSSPPERPSYARGRPVIDFLRIDYVSSPRERSSCGHRSKSQISPANCQQYPQSSSTEAAGGNMIETPIRDAYLFDNSNRLYEHNEECTKGFPSTSLDMESLRGSLEAKTRAAGIFPEYQPPIFERAYSPFSTSNSTELFANESPRSAKAPTLLLNVPPALTEDDESEADAVGIESGGIRGSVSISLSIDGDESVYFEPDGESIDDRGLNKSLSALEDLPDIARSLPPVEDHRQEHALQYFAEWQQQQQQLPSTLPQPSSPPSYPVLPSPQLSPTADPAAADHHRQQQQLSRRCEIRYSPTDVTHTKIKRGDFEDNEVILKESTSSNQKGILQSPHKSRVGRSRSAAVALVAPPTQQQKQQQQPEAERQKGTAVRENTAGLRLAALTDQESKSISSCTSSSSSSSISAITGYRNSRKCNKTPAAAISSTPNTAMPFAAAVTASAERTVNRNNYDNYRHTQIRPRSAPQRPSSQARSESSSRRTMNSMINSAPPTTPRSLLSSPQDVTSCRFTPKTAAEIDLERHQHHRHLQHDRQHQQRGRLHLAQRCHALTAVAYGYDPMVAVPAPFASAGAFAITIAQNPPARSVAAAAAFDTAPRGGRGVAGEVSSWERRGVNGLNRGRGKNRHPAVEDNIFYEPVARWFTVADDDDHDDDDDNEVEWGDVNEYEQQRSGRESGKRIRKERGLQQQQQQLQEQQKQYAQNQRHKGFKNAAVSPRQARLRDIHAADLAAAAADEENIDNDPALLLCNEGSAALLAAQDPIHSINTYPRVESSRVREYKTIGGRRHAVSDRANQRVSNSNRDRNMDGSERTSERDSKVESTRHSAVERERYQGGGGGGDGWAGLWADTGSDSTDEAAAAAAAAAAAVSSPFGREQGGKAEELVAKERKGEREGEGIEEKEESERRAEEEDKQRAKRKKKASREESKRGVISDVVGVDPGGTRAFSGKASGRNEQKRLLLSNFQFPSFEICGTSSSPQDVEVASLFEESLSNDMWAKSFAYNLVAEQRKVASDAPGASHNRAGKRQSEQKIPASPEKPRQIGRSSGYNVRCRGVLLESPYTAKAAAFAGTQQKQQQHPDHQRQHREKGLEQNGIKRPKTARSKSTSSWKWEENTWNPSCRRSPSPSSNKNNSINQYPEGRGAGRSKASGNDGQESKDCQVGQAVVAATAAAVAVNQKDSPKKPQTQKPSWRPFSSRERTLLGSSVKVEGTINAAVGTAGKTYDSSGIGRCLQQQQQQQQQHQHQQRVFSTMLDEGIGRGKAKRRGVIRGGARKERSDVEFVAHTQFVAPPPRVLTPRS